MKRGSDSQADAVASLVLQKKIEQFKESLSIPRFDDCVLLAPEGDKAALRESLVAHARGRLQRVECGGTAFSAVVDLLCHSKDIAQLAEVVREEEAALQKLSGQFKHTRYDGRRSEALRKACLHLLTAPDQHCRLVFDVAWQHALWLVHRMCQTVHERLQEGGFLAPPRGLKIPAYTNAAAQTKLRSSPKWDEWLEERMDALDRLPDRDAGEWGDWGCDMEFKQWIRFLRVTTGDFVVTAPVKEAYGQRDAPAFDTSKSLTPLGAPLFAGAMAEAEAVVRKCPAQMLNLLPLVEYALDPDDFGHYEPVLKVLLSAIGRFEGRAHAASTALAAAFGKPVPGSRKEKAGQGMGLMAYVRDRTDVTTDYEKPLNRFLMGGVRVG